MTDLEQKFDGILMTVIQQGGGLNEYLDAVFGFLFRKTDFFANDSQARAYVETHFKKWSMIYTQKKEREEKIKQRREEEEKALKKPEQATSATVKEITPEEYQRRKMEEEKKTAVVPEPRKDKDGKPVKEEDCDKLAEGHIMPNKTKGATLEKYSWGQMDIKEISINIPFASNIRGKDIKVELTANKIYVGIKGQEPVLDGELLAACKYDSMTWTLEEIKEGKLFSMTFEKSNHTWWESVLKNDTVKVDTKKVQPEASSVSDIEDPELKAQVEKMMFDTRQKAMGKPTSDVLMQNPMLEDFIKKHPEMDFSKCNYS